jgi:uncharacterized membrane protein
MRKVKEFFLYTAILLLIYKPVTNSVMFLFKEHITDWGLYILIMVIAVIIADNLAVLMRLTINHLKDQE